MKLKLLALAGIMAATMGLTACDSNQENAAEDIADAQEEVADATEELAEADVATPAADAAVADAAVATDEAQAAIAAEPTDMTMDAEVPADGAMATDPAVDAADEVVVVEPAQ